MPPDRPDTDALRADRADLAAALHDDLVYLDLGVWTGATARSSSPFDPGRHAFFGSGRHDRALLIGPGTTGTTARFVLGTRSTVDTVASTPSPRPDLIALARTLNTLEVDPDVDPEMNPVDGAAWRHHDPAGASPELWFGLEGLPLSVEHAGPWLAPSHIDPNDIKRVIIDAVRDAWVVPHDDEEADEDEDIFAV